MYFAVGDSLFCVVISQKSGSQDSVAVSLFYNMVMQLRTWLESSATEDGPLRALLKSLAAQCSLKHRTGDGTLLIMCDWLKIHVNVFKPQADEATLNQP